MCIQNLQLCNDYLNNTVIKTGNASPAIIKSIKDFGVKALLTVGIPNTFGIGTQTYESKVNKYDYTDDDKKDQTLKVFIDKEIKLPNLNPEKTQTKETNNKITERLSDYDEATQALFIKKKKEYLKIELNKLKNNAIKVYVDKDGNATTTKDKGNSFKPFIQLTKEQIQNVISSSISGNVTEKVKKEVLKGKTPVKKETP